MVTRNDSCGRSVHTRPAPSRMPTESTSRPTNSQDSRVRWSGKVLRPTRRRSGIVSHSILRVHGGWPKIERRTYHYNPHGMARLRRPLRRRHPLYRDHDRSGAARVGPQRGPGRSLHSRPPAGPAGPPGARGRPRRGAPARARHQAPDPARKGAIGAPERAASSEGGAGGRPSSAASGPTRSRFLRRLTRHNTREWFERNRAVYETEVRDPLRALVEEMDVRLARIAPELVGDPRRSIFRIHRDVRFSADKSPYKTNAACQFYHCDAGRGAGQDADGAGAGLYFQLADGECFVAGGIWMPARPALDKIREALADDPEGLRHDRPRAGLPPAVRCPQPRRRCSRGCRGDTPRIIPRRDWLRYKSFTGYRPLTPARGDRPASPGHARARLRRAGAAGSMAQRRDRLPAAAAALLRRLAAVDLSGAHLLLASHVGRRAGHHPLHHLEQHHRLGLVHLEIARRVDVDEDERQPGSSGPPSRSPPSSPNHAFQSAR